MSTSCAARRLTGRVVGAETAAVSQSDGVVVGDRLGVSYKKFQLEALLIKVTTFRSRRAKVRIQSFRRNW